MDKRPTPRARAGGLGALRERSRLASAKASPATLDQTRVLGSCFFARIRIRRVAPESLQPRAPPGRPPADRRARCSAAARQGSALTSPPTGLARHARAHGSCGGELRASRRDRVSPRLGRLSRSRSTSRSGRKAGISAARPGRCSPPRAPRRAPRPRPHRIALNHHQALTTKRVPRHLNHAYGSDARRASPSGPPASPRQDARKGGISCRSSDTGTSIRA